MYIYQLDRILLKQQIARFSSYITGDVLDVGGGEKNRYQKLFTYKTYKRLDIYEGDDVDIVASADDIPCPDASFDSVLSTQVLEHVQYPEKVAQEMYRVLKEGGHALITAPQWNELHEEPHDYWRYTKFGLRDLFERNGFSTVVCDQRGGYFSNREQMRMRFLMDKYRLYKRPVLGRLAARIFKVRGFLALWRDRRDTSIANRKHAIGWCFVFKKAGKNDSKPH